MMNERTTFTLGTIEYMSTENGRFYKTENGKKTRISKAAFDEAFEQYTHPVELADERPEVEEHDYIEYKGYKIFGNDNIRYVATAPYGGTSPESYATVDEAKAAIDVDLKAVEENAKKATEKPEKAHEDAKVQKGSKKAEGAKKTEKKAKEKAPKIKKVPEGGAAFEINDLRVVLTAKQVDFIKHLPDTCFWERGVDSSIWIDCLCDEIKGQFEGKPMTVGAMVSTLCEKGLGVRATDRINGRKATSFHLTDLGQQVAIKLGL